MWKIAFPAKLISPNRPHHWSKKAALNKKLDGYIKAAYVQQKPTLTLPASIQIIRVAPRELDSDNLIAACKGIRDSIAAIFFPDKARGQADNTKEITWNYTQRRGKVKEYLIEIVISCP